MLPDEDTTLSGVGLRKGESAGVSSYSLSSGTLTESSDDDAPEDRRDARVERRMYMPDDAGETERIGSRSLAICSTS